MLDFPLRSEAELERDERKIAEISPRVLSAIPETRRAASLSSRWRAFAADAACVFLLVAAAVLAATARSGSSIAPVALLWAGGFALYLSLFTTVLPLTLFGRTIGMALTGLSARPRSSPRVTSREALRRWIGTVLTAASGGIALLFTARDPERPSPADRLSGRILVDVEEDDEAPVEIRGLGVGQ
jgi:hypothetical protein